MYRYWILLGFLPLFLGACSGAVVPLPQLEIEHIVSSKEPIDPTKPLPEFTQYFATGTTVVHSYVWLKNFESTTGSYVVRMRWHYPNDFRPPMAQRVVTLDSGQNVAQFSFHDENGIAVGPYLLDVRTGKDEMNLTASGSARFFIGMDESAAAQYLIDEAEFKQKWEEDRAKKEAEQKKMEEERRAREEKLGWEKRAGIGGDEVGEELELPPSLTGGE